MKSIPNTVALRLLVNLKMQSTAKNNDIQTERQFRTKTATYGSEKNILPILKIRDNK